VLVAAQTILSWMNGSWMCEWVSKLMFMSHQNVVSRGAGEGSAAARRPQDVACRHQGMGIDCDCSAGDRCRNDRCADADRGRSERAKVEHVRTAVEIGDAGGLAGRHRGEDEGVRAGATGKRVSIAADQDVVPGASIENVMAASADQEIVAVLALETVPLCVPCLPWSSRPGTHPKWQ
jgi:hypothetical protein